MITKVSKENKLKKKATIGYMRQEKATQSVKITIFKTLSKHSIKEIHKK